MPKAFDDEYRHVYAAHHAAATAPPPQQTYYLPSQPNAHHYAPTQHLPALPPVHAHPHANGYTNGYAAQVQAATTANQPPPTTTTSSPTVRGHTSASPYAHGGHSARASPLHRGEACLTCRRRKMKCDAGKPSCGPCSRQGKADECEYEESRFLAQIARLETEVATLRARIRQLEGQDSSEGTTSGGGSNTSNTSPTDGSVDLSGAGGGAFTAYLPNTSNVRRSPSDSASNGTGMGPPSVGNGSRPASAYGFHQTPYDAQGRPGTAGGTSVGGFSSSYSGTHTPAGYHTPGNGTGTHTPSPPGGQTSVISPGAELASEVFGRM